MPPDAPAEQQLAERIVHSDVATQVGLTFASKQLLLKLARATPGHRLVGLPVDERVALHRLRKHLDFYFNKTLEGRAEKVRFRLQPHATDLELEPNVLSLTLVEHFWDAHCVGRPFDEPLRIIYTEPLFFWSAEARSYVRYLDINWESPADVPADLLAKATGRFNGGELVASFHYQPSGEIAARNLLLGWFRNYDVIERQRIKVDSQASRLCVHEPEWWRGNTVLLGNRRTNTLIRKMQEAQVESLPIVIEDSGVVVKDASGVLRRVDDARHAYVVLSRMPSMFGAGITTFIAANHGRAAEKIAAIVTTAKLAELYATCGIPHPEALPTFFQILFRVDIFNFDTPVTAGVLASTFGKPRFVHSD